MHRETPRRFGSPSARPLLGHLGASIALAMALSGCAGIGASPDPGPRADFVIAPAEWHSRPGRIPRYRRHTPTRITVHHAGVPWTSDEDPYVVLPRLQAWGRREKGWPDVAYHFLIAPDGRIFEGRPIGYRGETQTGYDVEGHVLVQLWGNFEEQRVSLEQLESLVRLIVWLCRTLGIDPRTVTAHRDWSPETVCPGKDLYRYIAGGDVRRWAEESLAGAEPEIELRPPLANGPTELVPGA